MLALFIRSNDFFRERAESDFCTVATKRLGMLPFMAAFFKKFFSGIAAKRAGTIFLTDPYGYSTIELSKLTGKYPFRSTV